MERAHVFEAAMIIALMVLAGLLYLAIVSTAAPVATGWEMQGNGSVDYMLTGSDDTLFVFQGNNVTAIRNGGLIAWSLHVPDKWNVFSRLENGVPLTVVDEASGFLYLHISRCPAGSAVLHDETGKILVTANVSAKIVAISPAGDIAWEYTFDDSTTGVGLPSGILPDDYYVNGNVVVQAQNGRILVFHNNSEDVLNSDGRLQFSIPGISSPAAIDREGYVYAARTTGIDAYNREGQLLWSRDIGEKITGSYDDFWSIRHIFRSLPICVNDTLYVPVENGTAAIGTDGSLKWIKHLTEGRVYPFMPLPVDRSGNVYMMTMDEPYYNYVIMISPDGTISREAWRWDMEDASATGPAARNDGTIYLNTNSTLYPFEAFNRSVAGGHMTINTLTAYDIGENRALWSFTVPDDDVRLLTLNRDNIYEAMPGYDGYLTSMNEESGLYGGRPADSVQILPVQDHRIKIIPGKNVVYMCYYSIMFEYPIIFNRSRAVYVNSLYALDNNGTLLWKQPMDGYVTHAVTGNDTFYYSTNGGRIGGNAVNAAAGVALVAIAYMFLRFFMVGAVARAKTRLNQNENRNVVLRYVVANPGVTATDLARDLAINIGTIRYHLFVLTMNHKVITYRADNKYLRYFTNAGTYTKEEQSLLALLRRDPLRETLRAVAEKPGLSGPELAEKRNVSTTAAHRDLTVLAQRGIIEQVPGSDRGHGYSIKDEHRERVRKAMELLGQHS